MHSCDGYAETKSRDKKGQGRISQSEVLLRPDNRLGSFCAAAYSNRWIRLRVSNGPQGPESDFTR